MSEQVIDANKIAEQVSEKVKETNQKVFAEHSTQIEKKIEEEISVVKKAFSEKEIERENQLKTIQETNKRLQDEILSTKDKLKKSFNGGALEHSEPSEIKAILEFEKQIKAGNRDVTIEVEPHVLRKAQAFGSVARGGGFYPEWSNAKEVQKKEMLSLYNFFEKEIQNDLSQKNTATFYSTKNFFTYQKGEFQSKFEESIMGFDFKPIIPSPIEVGFAISQTIIDVINSGGSAMDMVNMFYQGATEKYEQTVSSQILYNTQNNGEGILSILGEMQNPSMPGATIQKHISKTSGVLTIEDLYYGALKLNSRDRRDAVFIINDELGLSFSLNRDDVGQFNNRVLFDTQNNLVGLSVLDSFIPVVYESKQGNLVADAGLRWKNDSGVIYNANNTNVTPAMLVSRSAYRIVQSNRIILKDGRVEIKYDIEGKVPFIRRQYTAGRVVYPEGIVIYQIKP